MQAIGRWILNASAVTVVAATVACGRDSPLAPGSASSNQGAQGGDTTGGGTRSNSSATGVSVTPGALALRVGDTGILVAALVDASNAVVEVPTGSLPWTSSNAAVATVSGTGTVTAIGAGTATVSVTAGGFSGSAQISVTAR